jgi:hypothetical protein
MSFEPVGENTILGGIIVPKVGVVLAELRNVRVKDGKLYDFYNTPDGERKVYYTYNDASRFIEECDHRVYVPGDFSKSFDLASEYEKTPPGYWLTGRNCMWLGLEVLQSSTSGETYDKIDRYLWNKNILHTQRNTLRPNWAKHDVNRLFGN